MLVIEPTSYVEQKTEPVTWFLANVSLDGWTGVRWSGRIMQKLSPDEINEFTKVVYDLMKLCPEFNSLIKYFTKHGKKIKCEGMDPTLAFLIEKPLMTYMAETTGPNFWIEAHRKENA